MREITTDLITKTVSELCMSANYDLGRDVEDDLFGFAQPVALRQANLFAVRHYPHLAADGVAHFTPPGRHLEALLPEHPP